MAGQGHLGGDDQLSNLMENAGSGLHISDVIDVIQMDTQHTVSSTGNNMAEGDRHGLSAETARIVIVEQPASKALRFRYECEGRSAGSIPGVNSTPENKTYPTIKVLNYSGRAAVIVSCVTKDPPYRPHPHNLVGKEGCKRGVFSQHVSSKDMTVTFSNLGIQCVKKKDIEEALKVRESIRVDPFRTGFAHSSHPTGIDLNAVRLCFQVFLEGPKPNTYTRALAPVVSEPIYDKKAMSDLVICKLSDASASVAGDKEMILLCEKVAKEDIQIRFYQELDNKIHWEAYADFQPSQVHKQVAISFRTPSYCTLDVPKAFRIFIQLRRPSDGATSEPLPFMLTPIVNVEIERDLKRKKQKLEGGSGSSSLRRFQEQDNTRFRYGAASPDSIRLANNEAAIHSIKKEPQDPLYVGPSLSPYPSGQSPQPMHSPQMSVGRTPSPADYQVHSPYGMGLGLGGTYPHAYSQQPFTSDHHGAGPPVTQPNPIVRNVHFAGGSCTTAPNFSPDPVRPGSNGLPTSQHIYPGMVEPVNNLGMGMSMSPGEYGVNYDSPQPQSHALSHSHHHHHQQHQQHHHHHLPNSNPNPSPSPSNTVNYEGVDPIAPVLGVSSYELRELNLNSGDLCSLGPIGTGEGTLSEQLISNLTLSEAEPNCSAINQNGLNE